MRGRNPKPTALKLLSGNPGKRPLNDREPQYAPASPEIPGELSEEKNSVARQEWERVVPQLITAGVAKRIDRTALVAYCIEYQRWVEAEAFVRQHGVMVRSRMGLVTMNPYVRVSRIALEMMMRFMSEFGMTPSARVRLKADIPVPESDPLKDFLNSRA